MHYPRVVFFILLTHNESLSDDYESWADYQEDYVSHSLVNYSQEDRFPVLSPFGEGEVFEVAMCVAILFFVCFLIHSFMIFLFFKWF